MILSLAPGMSICIWQITIRAQLMIKQSHTTTVNSKYMSRHLSSGCTVPLE